jgi:signal transduction histidine kinase/CheY-like chemotaxis protein
MGRLQSGHSPFPCECLIVRADDGEQRTLWLHGELVPGDGLSPSRMIGTATNITELRRAEASRAINDELSGGLLDACPIPILVLTLEPSARPIAMNRCYTETFGYTIEDISDPDVGWRRIYADPLTRGETRVIWDRALAHARAGKHSAIQPFEAEVPCRDGSVRQTEVHLGFYEKRALVILNDLTSRNRAERERLEMEAQLRHTQKLESIGVLSGGIAHDFNNLLTSVLGYASMALFELPDDSPVRPMLREIETAAERASHLTRQLLAYSGRGKFSVELLALDERVREMEQLLRTVVSKKARIELDLQPASISADPAQIDQIAMNLITNASDALGDEPGTISIRSGVRLVGAGEVPASSISPALPPGRYAFLEVRDTGCGMSEDTLARIFDPFFTTKFTGRGLGLAAVLGIVRSHRGGIQIASTPGRGTTFTVLFPAVEPAAAQALLPASAAPAPGTERGSVLIVDDEAIVRSFARRALESAGFATIEAADAETAIETFDKQAGEIQSVLLDLTMPRMDGWQLLERIRRSQPDIPVLIMSGYSAPETLPSAFGMGPTSFLLKPFRRQDLVDHMSALVAR